MTIKPTKYFGAYIAILSLITILVTVGLVKYYPAKYNWSVDKKEIEWGVKDISKKSLKDINNLSDPNTPITPISSSNSFDNVILKLEAIDYDWQKNNKQITDQINAITVKKRAPVLNIYPQFLFNEPVGTAVKIFNQPEYSQVMSNMCLSMVNANSSDQPIFINFAPSPDGIKNTKTPWVTSDGGNYIGMYEKFTETCREQNNDSKQLFVFVWTSAVSNNYTLYRPLDKYFDIVGMNVYSDERDPGMPNSIENLNYSFKNIFDPQYDLIKPMHHDVMIFMGVSGTKAYKEDWTTRSLTAISNLDIQRYLKFIIYDNQPRLVNDLTKDYTISPLIYPPKASIVETEIFTTSSTTISTSEFTSQTSDQTNQAN